MLHLFGASFTPNCTERVNKRERLEGGFEAQSGHTQVGTRTHNAS